MDFSAFDQLSIGILAVDTQMRITYCNGVYAAFLQKPVQELMGRDFRELMPHTQLNEVISSAEIQHGMWQQVGQGYLYGNRIPIIENGKVVGALAELLLQNTEELDRLAGRLSELELQLSSLRQTLADSSMHSGHTSLVYQSGAMRSVMDMVMKVAPLDTTVLITGETGSGKEVIMETLYQYSQRTEYPLVKVNCAAIPGELLESELFGYEKGAFTGALGGGKLGKFELANHGVLFLDEISSLPLQMQSKLLRVLQDQEIEPLGSVSVHPVDVKIIAATNDDLEQMVRQNRFRQDLFYRLNVVDIHIPPLRERREDILPLCDHFLRVYFKRFGKAFCPLSRTVIYQLQRYDWPGNVRELKNVMERLAIMCEGPQITCADLAAYTPITSSQEPRLTLNEQMAQHEQRLLLNALRACQGSRTAAAARLGIDRTTLYSKLKKYHILDGVSERS